MSRTPLGITPRWVLAEQRVKEIKEACFRYQEANRDIPKEWLVELAEVERYLEERNRNPVYFRVMEEGEQIMKCYALDEYRAERAIKHIEEHYVGCVIERITKEEYDAAN